MGCSFPFPIVTPGPLDISPETLFYIIKVWKKNDVLCIYK